MLSMSASLSCSSGNSSAATISERQPELAAPRFRHPARRTAAQGISVACVAHAADASAHDLFGATRPNRPAGLNTSTSTRIEKMITSVQAPAILAAHRLDQADDHAAHHRAGHVADAAQHRGGEGAQPGGEADDEAGEVVVQAEDQPARAGQRRAEEEGHHHDLVHLHAHHARGFRRPARWRASPCRCGFSARTSTAPTISTSATTQISTTRMSSTAPPMCKRTARHRVGIVLRLRARRSAG